MIEAIRRLYNSSKATAALGGVILTVVMAGAGELSWQTAAVGIVSMIGVLVLAIAGEDAAGKLSGVEAAPAPVDWRSGLRRLYGSSKATAALGGVILTVVMAGAGELSWQTAAIGVASLVNILVLTIAGEDAAEKYGAGKMRAIEIAGALEDVDSMAG